MSNYIVCFEMSSSITFTDEVRLKKTSELKF